MSASTRRLFIGIVLDDGARTACAAAADQLRRTGFAARYEEPEKLHVTLAFLGNVDACRYEEMASALQAAAARCASFAVALDRLGAFPHERKPRVVYVGGRDQGAEFRTLAQSVRDAYVELGFTFKDDAVAHVTIARVKEPRRSLPLVEFAPVRVLVERATLFESLFDKEKNTTRHQMRATVPLRDRNPPTEG
jgi:RNA 2',3'-cyclic 3'-phosphodiesterase